MASTYGTIRARPSDAGLTTMGANARMLAFAGLGFGVRHHRTTFVIKDRTT